jgi:hypothetical protein
MLCLLTLELCLVFFISLTHSLPMLHLLMLELHLTFLVSLVLGLPMFCLYLSFLLALTELWLAPFLILTLNLLLSQHLAFKLSTLCLFMPQLLLTLT